MIARLSGDVVLAGLDHLVIDVGGVGYRVFVSSRTRALTGGRGSTVTLHISTKFRGNFLGGIRI